MEALENYFNEIIWDAAVCVAMPYIETGLLEPLKPKIAKLLIDSSFDFVENKCKPGENLTEYIKTIANLLISELKTQTNKPYTIEISLVTKVLGHLFLQLQYFISQNTRTETVKELENSVKEAILLSYFEKQTLSAVSAMLAKSKNITAEFQDEFLSELLELFRNNLLQETSISDIEKYIESALESKSVNNLTICMVKGIVSGYIYEIIKNEGHKDFYEKVNKANKTRPSLRANQEDLEETIKLILFNWLNNSIIFELKQICPKNELEEFIDEIANYLYKSSQARIEHSLNKKEYKNAVGGARYLMSKMEGIDNERLHEFITNLTIAVEKISQTIIAKEDIENLVKLMEFKDLGSVSFLV